MEELLSLFDPIGPVLLLSALHWTLAIMLLEDLKRRENVLGRRKWPWAVLIPSLAFIGSLLYLLCHPAIIIDIRKK